MTGLRSVRNALLVAVLLGIPALLLRSSLQDPREMSALDRVVKKVGAPLEAGVGYAAGNAGRFFERWLMQARLQEVNEELAGENRRLRFELRALQQVEEENHELRRSLQMRDKVPEDLVAAEVTGVEQSPFFRVVKLRLDRDERVVRPGMAILADAGVVGRIDRATSDHSDVMLITDPRSKIAVEVASNRAPGILEGTGEDRCVVHVAADLGVKVGDLIQTSGVDELFPRGQPVGQVVRVDDLVGDQQRAHVVPAVRFDRLDMVWVVLASAPPPVTGGPEARPAAAAAGLGPLR
jgi:rod shape-determining protein MreC